MALKITSGGLFTRHFLVLKRDGVKFYEGTIGFGTRSFRFREIECVLLSADDRLSFQVGNEVFSIPTKPAKPKHRAVIDTLVERLESSRAATSSALRYS